jgi:hypothetical protein
LSQAIAILVAFAFAAACLFAFAGRAGTEPARTFFWGSFGYGLAVATGGVHLGAVARLAACASRARCSRRSSSCGSRSCFRAAPRGRRPRALAWVLPIAGLVVARCTAARSFVRRGTDRGRASRARSGSRSRGSRS